MSLVKFKTKEVRDLLSRVKNNKRIITEKLMNCEVLADYEELISLYRKYEELEGKIHVRMKETLRMGR